ncbi:MAG: heparinase II/III family protein [Thermodesulfobacteriota bacterium]
MLGPERFFFLNEEGGLDEGWNPANRSRLWVYNLHYFDDLNARGAQRRAEWHRSLIRRWIRENAPGEGTGWEPYPISLRVVNWIKWVLGSDLEVPLESEFLDLMAQSLAVQARFLERRLEHHLLGNHLLANAKALVFAGLFFQGAEAEKWLYQGFQILEREVSEQVLSDGGHFERSPMYHAIVLEDLLDLVNLAEVYTQQLGVKQVSAWRKIAKRMMTWLSAMVHPDGEIALFNDAAFGVAAKFAELSTYAERLRISIPKSFQQDILSLEDSGYLRISSGPAVAFLDAAPLGPDYLPGHGHADTLTFELSLWGRRVIVDSGTSTYDAGEEREKQRGTLAHNTVVIDGENSSEVWGSFRVARRAKPSRLSVEGADGFIVVQCSHNGYSRLPGHPIHNRKWYLGPKSLRIEDRMSGRFSRAVARYHFHPEIKAQTLSTNEGKALLVDGRKFRWTISGGEGHLIETSYHPEFGLTIQNPCLEVCLKGSKAATEFSWM